MKKIFLVLSLLALLLLTGFGVRSLLAQEDSETVSETEVEIEFTTPQIGVNFIGVLLNNAPGKKATDIGIFDDPSWIVSEFEALGVEMFRQTTEADLFWNNIQPKADVWRFETPDAMLESTPFAPVATLFAMQYASPTPPWETDPNTFQKTLGVDAKIYLDAVLERYADQITYWEIGNEMDHWKAADPNQSGPMPQGADGLPAHAPEDGFSPYEQGVFLAQVSDYIRSKDPDAVILLPGISGLDDYLLDVWLEGVIEGGGTDFFDIMNYHYYSDYQGFENARESLQNKMEELGIGDKAVWLTETGVSSDPTLTRRTDYPNSEEAQASDVFRRLIQAYAGGDSLVLWHTFLSSDDEGSQNDWRAYGLRKSTGETKKAWYTFKLFSEELIPFSQVEKMESSEGNRFLYKISFESSDTSKYVAWGEGTLDVPVGITAYASVVFEGAEPEWISTESGMKLPLTDIPFLLK